MKKAGLVCLAFAALACGVSADEQSAVSRKWMQEHLGEVRSVILVLEEGASAKKSADPAAFAGIGELKRMFPEAARSKKSTAAMSAAARNLSNMYVAEVSAAGGAAEALAALAKSPLVKYAEPDWPVELFAAPNDTHFDPEQWSLNNTGQVYTTSMGLSESGTPGADIDWLEAWESPDFPTNQILIAVVDTGVDYNHADMVHQMWTNPGEAGALATNGVDDDLNGYIDDWRGIDIVNTDSDPMDDNGHGTHCAGTIAAETDNSYGIAGICPSAKIMPIKIFDSEGRGFTSDGVPAIRYAADMGAKVINNSWGGGGYSQALQDAITYANEQGVSVMCAAGNNGLYLAMYPASYAGAVSVGATDSQDGRAYFSNYGPWVDVMAPGHYILSLLSGIVTPPYGKFDNEFLIISGTSMATPTASGAMGLLMSKHPGYEPWIYEKVMEATCNAGIYALSNNADMAGNWLGAGRVDVDDMLAYNATNAFVRSQVNLHQGFGRSFLVPGEATNLIIKIGTWLHAVEDLEVTVTALDADSTLNATSYTIGDLPAGVVTNLPEDTFVVGCTENAEWNSVKRFRVQLTSGGTVVETRTNGFNVFSGQVSEFCIDDLDDDGIREVIGVYGSTLSVFDQIGNLKWFEDLQSWDVIGSPAVGDVDGDGLPEIVFIAEKSFFGMVSGTGLFVYEHDGSINTNLWPVDLQGGDHHLAGSYLNSANQVGLMNADWDLDLEIVVSANHNSKARYGVFDGFGNELGYAQASTTNRLCSLPALGDIDGDGIGEIVSIETGKHGGADKAWLVVRDGQAALKKEIPLTGGTNVLFGSMIFAPVMADVDLDGEKEFVVQATFDESGYLTVIKQDGSVLDGFPVLTDNTTAYSTPVVADADNDGDLELFSFRNDLRQLLAYDHQGNRLPYFPLSDTNLPVNYASGYHPVIGDVDGDGEPELVYGGNYQLDETADDMPYSFQVFARDIKDGLLVPGFPVTFQGFDGVYYPVFRLALDSLTGDEFGTNQYLIAGIGSDLFVTGTGRPFDPDQQHWPQHNRDVRNSFHYDRFPGALAGGFSSASRFGVNAFTASFRGFYLATNSSPVTWFWNFGDGTPVVSGLNLDTPAHDYTSPGLYDVSLTLSNAAGETYAVTQEDFITVYSDLAVDFTFSPTNDLVAPIRVSFTDLSQNGPQSWNWDFGDGQTSTNRHPDHLYTSNGTFTVTLTVSNDFGIGGASAASATGTVFVSGIQSNVTVHYVSPNGSSRYPYKTWAEAATNLQDAISALEPGHSIVVTDGVYKAGGSILNPVHETQIRSVNGPAVTFIDGDHRYDGIEINGTNCLLEGFTIQNCVGQPPALDLSGAAYGQGAPGTVARNMIIRNNTRLLWGGTVYINGGALVDSYIYSNNCPVSAGAFTVNGLISNCVFKYNVAGSGEIVGVSGLQGALYNSLVAENTGQEGVLLSTGGNIYNTTIANNTLTPTSLSGGGMAFDGYTIDNASDCFNVISYGNSGGSDVYFHYTQDDPDFGKPQRRALIYNCCWGSSVSNQQAAGQVLNEVVGNPLFMDMAAGNYHLQSGSPCRDAGRDDIIYTNASQEVLVDLGSASYPSAGNWNNLTVTNAGLVLADLTNSAGASAGWSLEVMNAFDLIGTDGDSSDGTFDYPASAERDHLGWIENGVTRDVFRISGMADDRPYNVAFYSSRPVGLNANSRWIIGSKQTDILAAGGEGDYRYEELTGLSLSGTQMLIRAEHTGGSYAALSLLQVTEWDPASAHNRFADQTDLGGNPRLTGSYVDIGAYEWTATNNPAVELTAAPNAGPAPLDVSFEATAWDDGSIADYHWDFGDGTVTNGAALSALSHIFNSGWYAVTVTVTDNDGQTASAQAGVFADSAWPAAPSAFSAANISPSQNNLSWTDEADNETSYVLQRRVITNYTEIIVDDADEDAELTYSGDKNRWQLTYNATAYGSYYHACKEYDDSYGLDPRTARYTPDITDDGWYEIYEWHPVDSRHSGAVRTEIAHRNGYDYFYIDQLHNGGQWNFVGMWYLEKGSYLQVNPYGNDAWIAADAFKFVRVESWDPLAVLLADAESLSDASLTDDLTYGYRIAAENEHGRSPWVSAQVTIPSTNLPPVVNIVSLSPAAGVPDLAVDAVGAGTDTDGTIVNYLWNFGDGYSGSIQSGASATNARYVYRNLGDFQVTLTVTDDHGHSATVTNTVHVQNAVPNTPENLQAASVADSYMRVTWDDKAFGEERIVLHRQADGGAFSERAVLGESVEEYNDSDVVFGTLYGYRVRAESASGTSDWSTVGSAVFGNAANYQIPFEETFESTATNMAGVSGPLGGQHGWTAGPGAIVQSFTARDEQALALTDDTASHHFDGSPTNVWITLWMQPVLSEAAPNVDADAVAAFYANSNAMLVVFDGTNETVTAEAFSNDWNKIEVFCDFISKVWNLSLNGTVAATNLGFYADAAGFSSLFLNEGSTNTAYFDDIFVSDTSDASDTDGDGLPDAWEEQYFGSNAPDPDDAASNSTYTVRQVYIAGLDPTDPDAEFTLSNVRNILGWNATSGRVYTIYWTSNLLSSFQCLESNFTGGAFTDTTHGAESEGFYKIDVRVE